MAEKTDPAQFKSFDKDIKYLLMNYVILMVILTLKMKKNLKISIKNGLMLSLKDR